MAEPAPNLKGKDLANLDLRDARVRCASFEGARFTDIELVNTVFEGEVDGLVINGVDVTEFVNAELYKKHPLSQQLRGTTADEMRTNFDAVYARWDELTRRAVALGETATFERIDGEWSFSETLRHLVYATDAWFRHAVLDLPDPYHSIALSHDQARGHDPGIDLAADPSLDEVLAVRVASQSELRGFVALLTDDELDRVVEATACSGHPTGSFKIGQSLRVILNEEYWHSTYAERDLALLSR